MKKLLKIGSIVGISIGIMLVVSGIWGILFTYKKIVQEKIVTPADSVLPQKAVRGPLTLKIQADTMRKHTLEITEGKTYAEMPRQIPKLAADGKPLLDTSGKPVMTENTDRDIWVTATALITALNLGLLTYALCAFVIVCGLMFIAGGIILCALTRHLNFV
jgi:hypothetical protein